MRIDRNVEIPCLYREFRSLLTFFGWQVTSRELLPPMFGVLCWSGFDFPHPISVGGIGEDSAQLPRMLLSPVQPPPMTSRFAHLRLTQGRPTKVHQFNGDSRFRIHRQWRECSLIRIGF
jgi:hypothetical protein